MKLEEMIRSLATEERVAKARDMLSSALRLDAMIALKLAQLDRLRAQAARMGAVPGAARACEAEQAALEKRLLADYHALLERQQKIAAALSHVADERHRAVLEMRYIQGLPFFRIAMQMHYDERQIYRYHKAGLRHVAVLMALEDGTDANREKTD